jgi:hypothetical protein
MLLLPASAHAAFVQADDDKCAVAPCVVEMTVSPEAGERNDMTVARDGDGVVVNDRGANLVAGRNCLRREDGSVRCALARRITQFSVATGDGDDVLDARLGDAHNLSVYLGSGNDRFTGDAKVLWLQGEEGDDDVTGTGAGKLELRGQEGADVLRGGAGDDELSGGPGRDSLQGGAGADVLHGFDLDSVAALDPDRPEADVLDGGAGARDQVTYWPRRSSGVEVDLSDDRPDGSPGEGDVLRGVEGVVGTDLPDRLRGDDGPNRLHGQGSVDVLEGMGGDDRLRSGPGYTPVGRDGGSGPERVAGGAGDDDVGGGGTALVSGGEGDDVVRPGRGGAASCGPGRDLVVGTLWTPPISTACERWSVRVAATDSGPIDARLPHPRQIGGAVRMTLPCPATETTPCTLTLRVATRAGRELAKARATAPAGSRRALVARLPAAVRGRPVQAEVSVALMRPGFVGPYRGGVLVTLR